jgi:guanylate kinase
MINKIFFISGSVGAGKDSVLKGLRKADPTLHWAITTTTRKKRKGEKEGEPYYFMSEKDFFNLIKKDGFFEYENVYSDKYFGMTKKEIKEALKKKKNIIWQIDYRGYNNVKKKFPKDQTVSIFILPPSQTIAKERIIKRAGGESPEIIKERFELAKREIKASNNYDYQVINEENKLKETIQKVIAIIKKETEN